MKICLANSALHCGGAERALSELANFLAGEGYDVTIFLLFKTEAFYRIDPRVKIVEPDFPRVGMNKYIYGFRTIGYIRKSLKQINPDVILDFFFPSFFMLCTAGLPFPRYISIRNNPANKIPLDPFWLRRLSYKWARGIIAQTAYAARLTYEQVYHPNIKVIPNFIRAVNKKDVSPQNNIITVGRLVKGKGHGDLLEIFASLNRKDWKLVIAGDGPLRAALEQKAADLGIAAQTVFAGFQPDVDLVLQQAKIFAFCSYSEGFPNALLEAMATPLPCISYNCNAGPADVIKDGINGFLIPVGNKELFAERLLHLMDNEALRMEVAKQSAASVEELGSDRLFRSYLSFLSQKHLGKRILFFNVLPFPHSNDIHEQLIEDGYTIDFWYLNYSSEVYPWRSLERKVNYRVYKPGLGSFISLIRSAWKSELVVITGWNSRMHILLALFCKVFFIKYSFWFDVPEKPAPGLKMKVKGWFMKMADGLFVTGKTGIDFFVQQFKVKPSKCYDFPYLEVKAAKPDIEYINQNRNTALLNGDRIKVLLSNRFLKRKGYSTVLEAFQQLPPELLAQMDVTILGTGIEKEKYEKLFAALNADIKFKGWVEYDEYLTTLAANDVFIHASIHEPYGIPPMDAMKYGKLVIGSRGVMSCVDRIENDINGYLFDAGDGKALAGILSRVISDKSVIYQKGKAAFDTSMQYGYQYNKKAIDALLN